MRLLVVEDNDRLRKILVERLEKASYIVDQASTALEFRELVLVARHDLYLVDLQLPDEDGIELIRRLRRNKNNRPILVITAKADISERITGLNSGADDYLIKPFHFAELQARIRALLRRPHEVKNTKLKAGHLILYEETGDVSCGGVQLRLTPNERALLELLMRRSGTTVPKELIEQSVACINKNFSQNAIEQMVSRLRKTLFSLPTGVEIRTIRNLGYSLEEIV